MSKIELGQDVFSARFDTDILYRERFDAVPGRLYGWWWCITHEQGNRVVVAVGWFVKRSSICSAKYLGVPPNGKIESLKFLRSFTFSWVCPDYHYSNTLVPGYTAPSTQV
jgi:hypothetical protein